MSDELAEKGHYFDSEKAFREAVDPGRRGFLKKIGAVVAGAVALDRKLPRVPDPPSPVASPPIHIRSIGRDFAGLTPPVYSTLAEPLPMTCIPTYAWNNGAWSRIPEHAEVPKVRGMEDEHLEE